MKELRVLGRSQGRGWCAVTEPTCSLPSPPGPAVPSGPLCDGDGGDAVPGSGPPPAALCPSAYLLPGFQLPQVPPLASRPWSSQKARQAGWSCLLPVGSGGGGAGGEKRGSERLPLQRQSSLGAEVREFHLRTFGDPQPGLMHRGGERRGPESRSTLGVSLVSSVPDAWKPDFAPESEEAAHRISELKSNLNKQKGVTCRR